MGLPGSVPGQALEEQLDLVLERWLAERVGDAPQPAGVPLADQVKGKLLKAALRGARLALQGRRAVC